MYGGSMYGGGMYGSSMYGGGMYGGGMYGTGMNQNKPGFLQDSMITLESFSYLINCLCGIASSVDQNYEGLEMFSTSSRSKFTLR